MVAEEKREEKELPARKIADTLATDSGFGSLDIKCASVFLDWINCRIVSRMLRSITTGVCVKAPAAAPAVTLL